MLTLFRDFTGLAPTHIRSSRDSEIQRTDAGFEVTVNVPGFRPDQIQISVKDSVLHMKAEREGRVLTRAYELSDTIDVDRIEAKADLGVLTITIPLKPEAAPRQIPVKGAEN